MASSALPASVKGGAVPVIQTLPELRAWRQQARRDGASVGIVPTMGSLHAGHLNLVKQSMSRCERTVMTLYVNETQFAPHEDLKSYPRSLESDVQKLATLLTESPGTLSTSTSSSESPLVVFAPSRETMYPLSTLFSASEGEGMLQDTKKQKGAFVEVKGFGDVLEGAARPQFFRGVATVCTKLFNAVEPDHAFFGQKDIQQALLLKIMLRDLLTAYPSTDNFHIIPTTRDASDSLALSSRNAYLTPTERKFATVLYQALSAGKSLFDAGKGSYEDMLATSDEVIDFIGRAAKEEGVEMRKDYVEVFEKDTFTPLKGSLTTGRDKKVEAVICGAVWVGRTRLIDNLLLGWNINAA